jgi:hypothetical protein
MSKENHSGMISTRKTPTLSTRALWQFYQQSHLEAQQEELAKEIMNFTFEISLFIL